MVKFVTTALTVTIIFLELVQAQVRGSIAGSPVRGGSFAGASISTGGAHDSFRGRSAMRRFYPPFVLGDPFYYADYGSQPVVSGTPPQIVVVQVPMSAAAEVPQETRAEPLLIELQGDRYVRVGETQPNAKPAAQSDNIQRRAAKPKETVGRRQSPQPPVPDLQPVALIYRDGHREQIRDYTIAGGMLYASGNYWTDGYWTKKIQLSALDLPATQQASHANGVEFLLPNSPNDVVIRP